MAAMKPRTGDGPLEVTKEGRGIVMRVPLEGGGRQAALADHDHPGRGAVHRQTGLPGHGRKSRERRSDAAASH